MGVLESLARDRSGTPTFFRLRRLWVSWNLPGISQYVGVPESPELRGWAGRYSGGVSRREWGFRGDTVCGECGGGRMEAVLSRPEDEGKGYPAYARCQAQAVDEGWQAPVSGQRRERRGGRFASW